MIINDTLYITDSLSCKYILVDLDTSQQQVFLPVDNLFGHQTLTKVTASPASHVSAGYKQNDEILSTLVLAFFIIMVIFSREIINVLPAALNSLFSLKNHYKLEEKLALSGQRNVVTAISALYFPVLLTLMNSNYLFDSFELLPQYFLLLCILSLFALWLVRKGIYDLLSWLTKDKNTFKLIERIGYNHMIISVIFSLPAILLRFFWPETDASSILIVLLISILFVFLIYLVRGYQIIISHRYSHFFYILYLCCIELLPIALISNFILSY
ncbi:MAG: hypothetical protein A2X18_04715 [Bacteroidetes bacterium GWF2_40_14]|nr:MAG: hypothetical protein A2X18_04715 [Bacteroidetes bacterium GWF2_40_14]